MSEDTDKKTVIIVGLCIVIIVVVVVAVMLVYNCNNNFFTTSTTILNNTQEEQRTISDESNISNNTTNTTNNNSTNNNATDTNNTVNNTNPITNNTNISTSTTPSTTPNNNVTSPIVPEISNPVKGSDFPTDTDDKVFSIQYKNSTDIDIVVWLDDQPFCRKDSSDAPCRQGGGPNLQSTDWLNNLGKFYVLRQINGTWISEQSVSARKQTLKPGEVWRIVPPTGTNGKPYWCFDQGSPICPINGRDAWCQSDPLVKRRRNCPGVGAWVTPANTKMLAIDQVTKFEYNINNGELWFDVSSVDGINTNTVATYTGCTNKSKTCMIDLSSCPVTTQINGVKTCPSPKTWKDIMNCGSDTGFSAREMAGCGYSDNRKALCHKWWAKNQCAQKWLNWLQKNPSGKCDQYGWAYDEMRFRDGDGFDKNFNPCITDSAGRCVRGDTNPVEPLIQCPINKGSLNINILNIMH